MIRNIRKLSKKFTIIIITLLFIGLIDFIIIPVQANFISPYAFSAEVILNKEDIDYDLSPLEEYAEQGYVKIFESAKTNNIPGTFESRAMMLDSSYQTEGNINSNDNLQSTIEYLYRSHYNSDVGVVVSEVNKSYLNPNVKPVNLEITKVSKILGFNFELELNDSIVQFMKDKQFILKETLELGDFSDTKTEGIYFIRGQGTEQLEVYIGSSTNNPFVPPNQVSDDDVHIIWASAPKGKFDFNFNQVMKDLLEFQGLDSTTWDSANHFEFIDVVEITPENEWVYLTGLSVKIVIPTEDKEIITVWQTFTLGLDFKIETDDSILVNMKNQGYEEVGKGIISENYTLLSFKKGNIFVSIASGSEAIRESDSTDTFGGDENKSYSEPAPPPVVEDDTANQNPQYPPGVQETVITVQGPKVDVVNTDVDQDMQNMLEFLGVDPNEWANATRAEYNVPEISIQPSVPIDHETFDWTAAIATELQWLREESIIIGITDSDMYQIAKNVKLDDENAISRIVYYNNTFNQVSKTDLMILGYDELAFQLNKDDMPPPIPSEGEVQDGFFPHFILTILSAIVLIIAIGTFSYSRLKRRSILDNLNRKNIFEHIKANPGIHFKKLLRELDFKPGALSYHLNVLEKGEFIKSIQHSNLRKFYLFNVKSDLKIALTKIQLRILSVVDERPGISQSSISRTIGKNRMVVNYHIKILADAGILSLEKSGRTSECYTTKHAALYLPG